ncbi:hypothetical protein LWI29_015856 [Acer saccharum]|uniref:DUF1985 domain-containing protein n=1 Tax=Acer saccharum TaxID=4024 RepID=A0AA39SEH2_ACESA|nr:hypothetical protein LWI29_015856 [Acer saccharum]
MSQSRVQDVKYGSRNKAAGPIFNRDLVRVENERLSTQTTSSGGRDVELLSHDKGVSDMREGSVDISGIMMANGIKDSVLLNQNVCFHGAEVSSSGSGVGVKKGKWKRWAREGGLRVKDPEGESMMAPKLVHDIKEDNSFRPKITCFSSLKAVYHIIRKLTEKQMKVFENTCFGHFLGMHKLQFSIPIVHCLLLRVVESPNTDEMWFKVGDTTIRFSAQEFRIVTGLNCSPHPKVNVHNKKIEGIGLMEDLLNRDMSLYNDNLESIFMEASSDNDLFMVKLALLYFLETVLLGREKKSPIEKEHILLVDDIEEFNKYPWGWDCFERTMKSLQEAVRVQKNHNYKAYDLKGFAYAFQVWAYEVIPTLGHRCACRIGLGLACIVNWSSVGSPSYKKVQGIFEEKNIEVCTVLQAVTEEQQDSCQNFITPVSDEVPQKPMDEDAHQGDPADTAEEYNSATAAAFPFPLAEASKNELSTPAHCCEVESQTEEFPLAAIAESLREEAVMSTVAITVTEKRKSPDEAALEVCTVLQVVTEEQQDSCQNFIATPGSDDEVPPTSIQENEMFEATSPSMDGDAHQGDPAGTAEDYYSATAAAFPFPLVVPSKEEWSTPAHRCEVEGQIESPTAMAESFREVAVTSTLAIEVTTKKNPQMKLL